MTRTGDWMQTFTGRQFFPIDPDPADVDVRDIAHHLSLICRYNGAAACFYSVAEHCVALSYVVPAHLALQALMHDAAEAYIGDLTRPMKNNIRETWEPVEERLMSVLMRALGIEWPLDELVDQYDTRILNDERAALLAGRVLPWLPCGDRLGIIIRGLQAPDAEREFLDRWHELDTRRKEQVERKAPVITERSADDGAPIPAFLKRGPTAAEQST